MSPEQSQPPGQPMLNPNMLDPNTQISLQEPLPPYDPPGWALVGPAVGEVSIVNDETPGRFLVRVEIYTSQLQYLESIGFIRSRLRQGPRGIGIFTEWMSSQPIIQPGPIIPVLLFDYQNSTGATLHPTTMCSMILAYLSSLIRFDGDAEDDGDGEYDVDAWGFDDDGDFEDDGDFGDDGDFEDDKGDDDGDGNDGEDDEHSEQNEDNEDHENETLWAGYLDPGMFILGDENETPWADYLNPGMFILGDENYENTDNNEDNENHENETLWAGHLNPGMFILDDENYENTDNNEDEAVQFA
ncbi:hypothetical protein B0T17DRAFT_506776 [Bombardia bombarda]|uniref:Uncharacterized protein n=1 Tax=Bombardia bombarda TaxID=252184 RepID=A0AA40C9Q2_9PEZI|nr:hypothetical protein B0T17DRAFT_506776 [Bombardia bombarda]